MRNMYNKLSIVCSGQVTVSTIVLYFASVALEQWFIRHTLTYATRVRIMR